MRRKKILFIALLSFLLSACLGGKPNTKDYKVGVIIWIEPLVPVVEGIQAGLKEQGYVEGENITFLNEGALGSLEAVESTVQRYIEADVDAIISISTPPTQIVMDAVEDSRIPVVFGATDPVGAELVESLAHPGGNLTGVATGIAEDIRLEWLLRMAPDTQIIYAPYNPEDKSGTFALGMVTGAAEELGVKIVAPEVSTSEDVIQVIESMPSDIDAIFMLPDSLIATGNDAWFEAALVRKLPLSSSGSPPSETGQLVSYGFTLFDAGEQMSRILIKVLEGADPADLPVETVEFYLGINLVTAERIGLDIPDEILQAADHIIRE